MLRLQKAPRFHDDERFDSDRESLPFPCGGVFGRTVDAGSTQNCSTVNSAPIETEYAHHLLHTIDQMQSSLDTLERELGAELERELRQIGDVIGRIGAIATDDWPPAAA